MKARRPTSRQCKAALLALERFRNSELLTPDEKTAWDVLYEGISGIARGETLDWKPGDPMRMRLVRRVRVEYFHPQAPRREVIDTPPQPEPDAEPETISNETSSSNSS